MRGGDRFGPGEAGPGRRSGEEHAIHAIPAKIAEQLRQALFHPLEVEVVTKARLGARTLDERLFRVDFPRVEGEHGRHSVRAVHASDGPARKGIRPETEVSAAAA